MLDVKIVLSLFGAASFPGLFRDFVLFSVNILPFAVLGLLIIITFWREKPRENFWGVWTVAMAAATIARVIITELIRFLWNNPRPFDALSFSPLISEKGASFPSGHAAFFFAIAFALWFSRGKLKGGAWISAIMFIAAVLNGIARVSAGVHWPTDILGGVMVGLLGAVFARRISRFSFRGRSLFKPFGARGNEPFSVHGGGA